MRVVTLILVSAAILFAFSPAFAKEPALRTTPDGRPLRLVFDDDFSSFRLWGQEYGLWRTTYGDGTQLGLDRRNLPSNGELEIYVDGNLTDAQGHIGLNPFHIRNGQLDILAAPTPVALRSRLNDYPYVSGMISSQPSFSQLYGYFEMRARLPDGRGLWPAFWLLPKDLSWPPEIDVMESVGDSSRVYSTAHSNLKPAVEIEAHVTPNQFHTYAVSWDAERLIFYVDNRKTGEQTTPADFTKPMYMIANLAIGGNWAGAPEGATAFPAKLTIDYIRAYKFSR